MRDVQLGSVTSSVSCWKKKKSIFLCVGFYKRYLFSLTSYYFLYSPYPHFRHNLNIKLYNMYLLIPWFISYNCAFSHSHPRIFLPILVSLVNLITVQFQVSILLYKIYEDDVKWDHDKPGMTKALSFFTVLQCGECLEGGVIGVRMTVGRLLL